MTHLFVNSVLQMTLATEMHQKYPNYHFCVCMCFYLKAKSGGEMWGSVVILGPLVGIPSFLHGRQISYFFPQF